MLHVVAFAAAALMTSPTSTTANSELQNVRTMNVFLAGLIADAREQSPTLAEMLDRVERSDVIVYFEAVPRFEGSLRGCVHFIGASNGYRYVRAQIKTMMNRYDVIASLAHELQHAVEIADHPEVTSEDSLAALYRRIGDERETRHFETDRAQSAGRVVRAEVIGAL
jgi:hypothetical protein